MYRHLEEIRPPKDTKTKDTEAVQPDAGVQQQDFPLPALLRCKGLTSCGYIFISCSGLFILVGAVYVELSFSVYYTANDGSVSLTPLASFK